MFNQNYCSKVAGMGMVATYVNKFSGLSQSMVSVGIVTGIAVGVSLSVQSNVYALSRFQGAYAPANWTLTNTDTNGAIDLSSVPSDITLIGGDDGSEEPGTTDYTITALGDGNVSFDWDYVTSDEEEDPSLDPFLFLLNGTPTQLTDDQEGAYQYGSASFSVSTGNTFGFRINTNNVDGAASVTISNFSAPDATAVPFEVSPTLGLLMLGGIYSLNSIRNSKKFKSLSK